MSCQQKSGVFLNISCNNNTKQKCSRCRKNVCDSHYRQLDSNGYCDDCFWELYILKNKHANEFENDDLILVYDNSTNSETSDAGFTGGFGGGSFDGGGASGTWTNTDIESFKETEPMGDSTLSDDTFFYS